LLARPLGKIGAADPAGEAEVIFNLRARSGLTTDGRAFDHDRLQPVRGAVTRRAEPRRPGAVDRQIVFGARGVAEPAELLGDLSDGRVLEPGAVWKQANREARIGEATDLCFRPGLVIAGQLDPAERHVAAMQEIANGISRRGPAPAQ